MNIRNKSLTIRQLLDDYEEILHYIKDMGYKIDPILKPRAADNDSGEAYVIAYPIQGLLKYHGMYDLSERIAYFPSISMNNDSITTISYLRFDPSLNCDIFILNGKQKIKSFEYDRVVYQLDKIRNFSSIKTKAIIISRNIITDSSNLLNGKGLGTSAAGGAAISKAAFSVLFNDPHFSNNSRLLSIFSRYLSGSASRSSVGGIALWLSSPQSDTWSSFALRLDIPKYESFINQISLITIPIPSHITTTQAHQIALKSPYYEKWSISRKQMIFKFLNGFKERNLEMIGKLTEEDSKFLHKIHSSTQEGRPYWNKKTRLIMKYVTQARSRGIPLYYSIDTGPSVVLITYREYEQEITEDLHKNIIPNSNILTGSVGGPSTLITSKSKLAYQLDDDIEKFCK
jgi:diphosphomevalonate decarboxylase